MGVPYKLDEVESSFTNVRASNRAKILVVDDMPIYLMVAQKILLQNYEVTTAKGAGEALEVLSHTFFDLVLLDIEMPEVSGVDMFKTMLASPDLCAVPVVFVTSDKESEVVRTVIRMGARDYIVKPYSESILLTKVNRILQAETEDQAVLFLKHKMSKILEYCDTNQNDQVILTIQEFPEGVYSGFVYLQLKRLLLSVRKKDIMQVKKIAQAIIQGL
ncbi:MAG: response regulator [Spirochaetaceae bacterium]|jgi:CheY-like chemotaxis protein|nr:response regulator [Spirochaetaceae bacterium]